MYQLQKDYRNEICAILRLSDNASIPTDPANTCYQQYLKWISEGNTPIPADEPNA
jgi:hypothetical protein